MMLLNFPSIHKDVIRLLLGIINGLCIDLPLPLNSSLEGRGLLNLDNHIPLDNTARIRLLSAVLVILFVIYDDNPLKQFGDDTAMPDGNEMLVFAAAMMLYAGIIGLYSAVKDRYKLLHEYICILIVMLALMLPISIYVFLQRATLDLKTQLWLHEQFYYNVTERASDAPSAANHWDQIQDTFQCCGFTGPLDYILLKKPLKMSCCPSAYRSKSKFLQKVLYNQCIISSSFVRVGCESRFQKSLQNDRYLLLGIAIVSFWFQMAGILTALCIANDLRKKTLMKRSNELSTNKLIPDRPLPNEVLPSDSSSIDLLPNDLSAL